MAAAGIRWSQWMNAKSQAELLVQKKPALLRNSRKNRRCRSSCYNV